jgi:ATP-dependent DNA helicase PIF1
LRKGKAHLPFGGIQVLLFGDFFQLPPIQGLFCFMSLFWNAYFPPSQCIRFNVVFRQKDEKYIRLLNHVRQGELTEEDAQLLESRVNQHHEGFMPTKLFATRRQVEETNRQMFDALEGEIVSFAAVTVTDCTTYKDGSSAPLSPEDIERGEHLSEAQKEREIEDIFKQQGYKEFLPLKVGCAVMCTSNIDVANGICNGSQGIIESMDATGPVILFHNQIRMRIPKIFRHSAKYPTIAVGQFPLHLAWAITIHKIQGASIELAEMDLGSHIFECGQSYVALSRVKSLEGLFLISFDKSKIKSDPHVVAFERSIFSLDESEMQTYIENAITQRSLTKRISMPLPITAFFKKQKHTSI